MPYLPSSSCLLTAYLVSDELVNTIGQKKFWDWFAIFASYNGISSSKQRIKSGAPQGSILGPLLFFFFIKINDLYLVCKHTNTTLFANDTSLFSSGKDLTILESTTNSELSNISLWSKVNTFSLNIKKTHYMIFFRRKKLYHNVKLLIDGQAIDEVQKTELLGIIIDNKLTWKWHNDHIASKISSGIGMIIKARQYLNKSGLLSPYHSFIYTYLTYCKDRFSEHHNSRHKFSACSGNPENVPDISVLQRRLRNVQAPGSTWSCTTVRISPDNFLYACQLTVKTYEAI